MPPVVPCLCLITDGVFACVLSSPSKLLLDESLHTHLRDLTHNFVLLFLSGRGLWWIEWCEKLQFDNFYSRLQWRVMMTEIVLCYTGNNRPPHMGTAVKSNISPLLVFSCCQPHTGVQDSDADDSGLDLNLSTDCSQTWKTRGGLRRSYWLRVFLSFFLSFSVNYLLSPKQPLAHMLFCMNFHLNVQMQIQAACAMRKRGMEK